MLARTHLAFGFLTALLSMSFVGTGNKIIFFGLVLLSALLPDIDSANSKISKKFPLLSKTASVFTEHRGVFHTLFLAFVFSALFWFFISKTYAIAIFIGYFSHLLIDGFTKAGINLLHPFAKLNISGFITTGSAGEYIVLGIIIILIIWKLI